MAGAVDGPHATGRHQLDDLVVPDAVPRVERGTLRSRDRVGELVPQGTVERSTGLQIPVSSGRTLQQSRDLRAQLGVGDVLVQPATVFGGR